MRNPKWHRDEIILALDLYFNEKRGSIDKKNPKIIEVSEAINLLPLFADRPDAERFRNPNGVTLKLSNFLALDPSYKGQGMKSYSKLDAEVFNEFLQDRERLAKIASQIKNVAFNKNLRIKLYQVEEDEQTIKDSVMEGRVLYKLHKVRERDSAIIRAKKQKVLELSGYLDCEVCVFNFEKKYGEIGAGYIECHHKIPLSSLEVTRKTHIDDLALVCSNCHSILHRSINTLTVQQLRCSLTG